MTDEHERVCKIVLLGESGVGKTSIINRIVDQSFDSQCQSTGKAYNDYLYLPINKKKEKFDIWDTAGQERYRSLTSMFYKNASAVILVYDITSLKSFEEIQKYWERQVKDICSPDVIIALAANKGDLFEDEQVNEEKAKEYAEEINAIFKSTSAFTEKGIELLFIEIGKRFFTNDNNNNDEWNHVVKIDANSDNKIQSKKPKTWC